VEEEEVEEVLANPGEDRPGREGSRVGIGETAGGRYLESADEAKPISGWLE